MAPLIFLPRRTKTVNVWQGGSGPTWPSLALLHPYIRIKIRGEESDNKKSRNSVSGGREWLTQESVQNDIKLSCWVVVTRCQGRFKTQFLFLKAWHLLSNHKIVPEIDKIWNSRVECSKACQKYRWNEFCAVIGRRRLNHIKEDIFSLWPLRSQRENFLT